MNALSRQEVAALREGDIVYVRMVVRKPLGEYGTVHCRIHDEKTWRAHYVPVFPEHIVGIDAGDAQAGSVGLAFLKLWTSPGISAYASPFRYVI